VSLSSHILSCFAESCSSQWSSSTKVSMHYEKQMRIWIFVGKLQHTFFFLSTRSSIKYVDDHRTFISRMSWTGRLLFALIWMVLHISFRLDDERSWPWVSDDISSRMEYRYIPWPQLPIPALPHHVMLVYVRLAALDRNGVTCYRSRWVPASPGWWHVQDSCCLWVTECGMFMD